MKKIFAILLFIATGFFGLVTLNSFGYSVVLFPALTGMFGLSGLLFSIFSKSRIPPQNYVYKPKIYVKGSVTGWLAGLLVGILPGIGASQASIISAKLFNANPKEFLAATGGINAANMIFTFIVLFTLEKTRSGAAAAISQFGNIFTHEMMFWVLIVSIFSAIASAFITLKSAKVVSRKMEKINYSMFTLVVAAALVVLVFVFTGFIGLLILITSTFVGCLATLLGIGKHYLMGFLILPTILYFSGLTPLILHALGI